MLAHGADDGALTLQVALGGSNEQAVAALLGHIVNALEDFAKERVVNRIDNHPQHLRTVGLQAAGGGGGLVAQLSGNLPDVFRRRERDQRAAAQGARDSSVCDPRSPGDILDGNDHSFHSSLHTCALSLFIVYTR